MPTLSVKRDLLFKIMGKRYTDDEFAELCFAYGLELDEVTSERLMIRKETGAESGAASDDILYRIDVPANRYDLLCIEGLTRGLLIFLGKKEIPNFTISPEIKETLSIAPNTQQVRPFCVAAVLRNITFSADSYNSFIDLQDKLHQNLCRRRSLVAIGTHDLDTVKGPFVYDALPPQSIRFRPLNQEKEMTAPEIMQLYSHHAQLKQYLHIIQDSPVYPLILDSQGVVLSMPPIINGNHSKITLATRNVFIECTATDAHRAQVVLDTLVCMFSQYCAQPFQVERVEIGKHKTPQLQVRTLKVDAERAAKIAGVPRSPPEVAALLRKMGLQCQMSEKENSPKLKILVPPTRHDILHERDIIEDLAIAYGYNNIVPLPPPVPTVGRELPLNKLTDLVREEVARCGFTEALTFSLCSADDIGKRIGRELTSSSAVHVSNPKTLEFQTARTLLLPCLLRTIAANKKMPLPLRIFEASDVVLPDEKAEVGARNERHLCAVSSGKTASFEIIHGLLDRVMRVLNVKVDEYRLVSVDDKAFLPKRHARVEVNGVTVGAVGVIHPAVLNDFELTTPCSSLELNLEPFL